MNHLQRHYGVKFVQKVAFLKKKTEQNCISLICFGKQINFQKANTRSTRKYCNIASTYKVTEDAIH